MPKFIIGTISQETVPVMRIGDPLPFFLAGNVRVSGEVFMEDGSTMDMRLRLTADESDELLSLIRRIEERASQTILRH